MPTYKQYLVGWTDSPKFPDLIDYWFSPESKDAKRWSKEHVEGECIAFTNSRISVRSIAGENHVCAFRYEELGPNSFGIYCLMPFIPEQGMPYL